MLRGVCLLKKGLKAPIPPLVLGPVPLQVSVTPQTGRDSIPHILLEIHDLTPDPLNQVAPDLVEDHGLIPDSGAGRGPEVDLDLCLDLDHVPTLDLGLDPIHDTDRDLYPHLERGAFQGLLEEGKPVKPNQSPQTLFLRSFQKPKGYLLSGFPLALKVSQWSPSATALHLHAGSQDWNPGSPPMSTLKK